MSDYPTEAELEELRAFDTLALGVKPLVERVRELWWKPDWGFRVYRTKDDIYGSCIGLELHTGGWSGNESIISALEQNYLFWALSWSRSSVGGHYWFRISRDNWRKGRENE